MTHSHTPSGFYDTALFTLLSSSLSLFLSLSHTSTNLERKGS